VCRRLCTAAIIAAALVVTLAAQTPTGLPRAAVASAEAGARADAAAKASWVPDRGDGTYTNPIIYADYSDPDVIRVGRDYYMVASSFNAVPGLPILHSRDMVNWSLIGHALPRLSPEALFATPQHGKGPWAPAIRFHAGRFWIYYPEPDLGIFLVTASDPAGPWSTPILVKGGRGLIDPCPLWDDDGQLYLVHAWARSRAGFANVLTLNRLSEDGKRIVDAGKVIIDGDRIQGYRTLEGPKFYKRNGEYWIFAPAGGVKPGWQSVFRSKTVDGPYESRIVLEQGSTDINGPHQGAWVDTPSGEDWFFHFQDLDAYGRVVHLQPMRWRDDGWPVMGMDADGDGKGEPVRFHRKPDVGAPAPGGVAVRIPVPPTSDEFSGQRLGLQWQWQANPQRSWMSLGAARGALRLYAVPAPASDNLWMAPNLLLQKFPAPEFVVTAALTFAPLADGDTAGLIVFGQDYAWVGLRKTATGLRLITVVAKDARNGKPEQEVAGREAAGSTIFLRVTVGQGGECRFSVSPDSGLFEPIGGSFVAKPGQWVGAKVGIFATARPDTAKSGHADWSWFRVERPSDR
jgi:beta-xylosidase